MICFSITRNFKACPLSNSVKANWCNMKKARAKKGRVPIVFGTGSALRKSRRFGLDGEPVDCRRQTSLAVEADLLEQGATFILLPVVTLRKLGRYAEAHGMTTPQMVAQAISKYVKELEGQSPQRGRAGEVNDAVSK